MSKPIIFWGATGHCKVLQELVGHLGYELSALFDNDRSLQSPHDGVPLYYGTSGFAEWQLKHGGLSCCALVAIGGARGRDRLQLQEFLADHGLHIPTVVHPSAFVAADVSLGDGTQILAHATVCADASIGRACIVNTRAGVDHESVLGDGVHIGPGATLAGCVSVGNNTMIGAGATLLPRIRIGQNSIVGAGSLVTQSLPDGVIAYGNPARVVRANNVK